MGTAPLRPAKSTKACSLRSQLGRHQAQPHEQRPDHESQRGAQHQAWHPHVRSGEVAQVHGQAQHHERDDLAEARERGMEALDLPFEGGTLVAQDDAGDEHRKEA